MRRTQDRSAPVRYRHNVSNDGIVTTCRMTVCENYVSIIGVSVFLALWVA